jgi:sterol 3beta-glucosyltransferase
MRITILALGTRGDVQPYVALGLGLQAAGHDVCVATHANFGSLVRQRGLRFYLVSGDPRALSTSNEAKTLTEEDRNVLLAIRSITRMLESHIKQCMVDCWQACEDAEAIVVGNTTIGLAFCVAEKLHVPLFRAYILPVSPTRTYPAAFVPAGLNLGGPLNLLTHGVSRQLLWIAARAATNRSRRDVLGLSPLPARDPFRLMDRQRWPVLYGYSVAVAPPPVDWGDWIHVTGYWFLDHRQDWQPPSDLVRFLEAGPPPVYVGFGSMSTRDPEATASLVVRSLHKAGRRGVLMTGWDGLGGKIVSKDVYVVDGIPHDWLFPRMAAVVHHGGTGTTAAGLRAGVPSVVVPFYLDQPFWGRKVHELGVGPRPIPRQQLTEQRLAEAISIATSDQAMQRRAASIGRQIRMDDGVRQAVEAFHDHVAVRAGATLV